MKDAQDFINDGREIFLVLDFDDVINQFPIMAARHGIPEAGRFLDFSTVNVPISGHDKSFTVTWSRELVKRLSAIAANPKVQVVWLTSWKQNIIPVAKLLRFTAANDFYVLDFSQKFSDYGAVFGKTVAFSKFFENADVDSGCSIVWADDTVVPYARRTAPVDDDGFLATFPSDRIHFVAPARDVGINRRELADIESFVKSQLK